MSHFDIRKILKETGIFLADIFYNAIVIIILVILIRSFIISPFRVVGSSMADTLENKEFILIDKFSYLIGDVDRGDPIVFLPPATSKDTPKFEEPVEADASGVITFKFDELIKDSEESYCEGKVLKLFWFCKTHVEKNDLVYFAPRKPVPRSQATETDWEAVQKAAIDRTAYKQGYIELPGSPGQAYTVRIYDSMGEEYFVKRVIGTPGDTVKIDNGRVYLKKPDDTEFSQIKEPFLNRENLNRTYISQKQRQNVYEVPEGHFFVMGDNRNHSNDSRSWLEPITQEAFPFVPEENLSGKVFIVLWPINHIRPIGSADF